jgi:hypothetical protein
MCNPENIGQRALKAGVSYGNFSGEFGEFLMHCDGAQLR